MTIQKQTTLDSAQIRTEIAKEILNANSLEKFKEKEKIKKIIRISFYSLITIGAFFIIMGGSVPTFGGIVSLISQETYSKVISDNFKTFLIIGGMTSFFISLGIAFLSTQKENEISNKIDEKIEKYRQSLPEYKEKIRREREKYRQKLIKESNERKRKVLNKRIKRAHDYSSNNPF